MNNFKPTALINLLSDGVSFHWRNPYIYSELEVDGVKPTEADIDSEVTRLQGIYDGQAYARLRKAKYDLLNQFELIGDDATNGTTTHKDAIAAIKVAHPKP